jgi:large subunit ribosomal protein L29
VKVDEMRTQEEKELALQLKTARQRIFDLRFKVTSEEISDTKELKRLRRDVARILTIQGERKRKQEKAGDGR